MPTQSIRSIHPAIHPAIPTQNRSRAKPVELFEAFMARNPKPYEIFKWVIDQYNLAHGSARKKFAEVMEITSSLTMENKTKPTGGSLTPPQLAKIRAHDEGKDKKDQLDPHGILVVYQQPSKQADLYIPRTDRPDTPPLSLRKIQSESGLNVKQFHDQLKPHITGSFSVSGLKSMRTSMMPVPEQVMRAAEIVRGIKAGTLRFDPLDIRQQRRDNPPNPAADPAIFGKGGVKRSQAESSYNPDAGESAEDPTEVDAASFSQPHPSDNSPSPAPRAPSIPPSLGPPPPFMEPPTHGTGPSDYFQHF